MRNIAIVIALVAIVVGVAVFMVVGSSDQPPADDTTATTEVAELRDNLKESETDRAKLLNDLAVAEDRIQELEADAAMNAEAPSEPDATSADPGEAPPEELQTPDDARERTLDDIRARIRDNAGARAQLTALSELMYSDFLNGVEMDAETKAEVRRLLADSYMETMALTQYALRGGEATWAEVRSWTLDERKILDEQLRGQLSDDAYKTWSEYSADLDERQLDGTLRNQIRALASGLTPENFDLVMQVAVQQFRAQQIALEQSDTPFTLEENVNYQLRAMDAMREQLQGVLSEDQFAELLNFITFGENALNAQLAQANRAQ